MITLIHGDNQVAAREYVKNFKTKYKTYQIENFNWDKILVSDIKLKLASNSLFSQISSFQSINQNEQKLAIIEKFKLNKDNISQIESLPKNVEIIIYLNNQLTPNKLVGLKKNWKVVNFKPEPIIFKFLDSITPGNIKNSALLYKKIIDANIDFSFFFQITIRHFRNLLLAKSNYLDNTNLASWQKIKFTKQSQNYSLKKLTLVYRYLFKIDQQIKAGSARDPYFYFSLLLHNLTVL